ncbi:MAG: hypothetical protein JWN24_1307 [Phycisphaerales bacterium]|nr:hypothetical protein [Phycisphaerales bacterium]
MSRGEPMNEPFNLTSDDGGRLVLQRPGHADELDVRICRCFPWSRPDHYLSVRDADGRELILIESLESLSTEQRQTIARWLADTSFIPKITSIDSIDTQPGHQHWKVQTDRGPAEFRVQEREDIRVLPGQRFRIKDADGNVYELPCVEELDPTSRETVEAVV